MGITNHLTCLLRNLYAGQEATVRTGHGITDWFKIGKGVRQGCTLSLCLFYLYADGLDEAQAGIKIAGRNINNLRYADDTTLMVESKEEVKSLLMKVKEESEKAVCCHCLFNLYGKYIMQNARLDDSQARIKITWRNINILRYADDTHSNG